MKKFVFHYPGDDLSDGETVPISVSGEGTRKVLGTGVYDEKNHTLNVDVEPDSEGAKVIERYFSESVIGGFSISNKE